jgi:hypothetical protein
LPPWAGRGARALLGLLFLLLPAAALAVGWFLTDDGARDAKTEDKDPPKGRKKGVALGCQTACRRPEPRRRQEGRGRTPAR